MSASVGGNPVVTGQCLVPHKIEHTEFVRLMDPKYIEVTGIFTPRGGISIYPYANYGRPGTKYEEMATHRLMNHE